MDRGTNARRHCRVSSRVVPERGNDVRSTGVVSMGRLVVEVQSMRWAHCIRMVEGDCWDHMDYPGLDKVAKRSFANCPGFEDVGYRLDLVP